MKERELRELCDCGLCGNKVKPPVFFKVTTEYYIMDGQAIQRQHGLENMLNGEVALAQIMGPDEDLAVNISSKTSGVCLDCFTARLPELWPDYAKKSLEVAE